MENNIEQNNTEQANPMPENAKMMWGKPNIIELPHFFTTAQASPGAGDSTFEGS